MSLGRVAATPRLRSETFGRGWRAPQVSKKRDRTNATLVRATFLNCDQKCGTLALQRRSYGTRWRFATPGEAARETAEAAAAVAAERERDLLVSARKPNVAVSSRCHDGAASRLHGISMRHPRRRRDAPA